MTATRRLRIVAAAALLTLAGTGAAVVRGAVLHPTTLTAYFTSATGIYPGDEVRVAGVKVGTITGIEPQAAQVKLTLQVNRSVPVRADAKAIIVEQNLVAARYVQLAPAYESSHPTATLADGAVIPRDRTAVPVEWDEVKSQLARLATDLGRVNEDSSTSVSHFIDSAADAMDGNGAKLRETLRQLSGVGRILADKNQDIVGTIKNLQTFVTTLRSSTEQIVEFQDRLATFSSVINDSRSDLDAMLNELSVTTGEVQRFIAGTRDKTTEQIQRLTNVTQVLVDHRLDVENILHGAPTAFSNGYNIYNPVVPGAIGTFLIDISNPVQFICGAIGAVENTTAPETAKLCAQYLGPALRLLNVNYLPFPTNPFLQRVAPPDKIRYAEPNLAPDGAGPGPAAPEIPPAVSAYTGLNNDVPPGPSLSELLRPGPSSLPELLLPSTPPEPGPPS
ncbi:MCE family protein [Mycobacterium sp. pUA109]|uniref:MCE family protein n=1 Tax=Mycobacterium sp. pUA109 TaxID=3238982 RepID=UPI00351BDA40